MEINKDNLIDVIENAQASYSNELTRKMAKYAADAVIEYIEQVSLKRFVMWRSVKDELPLEKGRYYVAIALQGKKEDPSIEPATYMGGGKWRTYGLGEVLFWMEIPELPQAT